MDPTRPTQDGEFCDPTRPMVGLCTNISKVQGLIMYRCLKKATAHVLFLNA